MSWLKEIEAAAATKPHIVLTGNTWDLVLTDTEQAGAKPVLGHLQDLAARIGLRFLVVADPVRGLRLWRAPAREGDATSVLSNPLERLPTFDSGSGLASDLKASGGTLSLSALAEIIAQVADSPEPGGVVVIEAARLIVNIQSLQQDEHNLYKVAAAAARGAVKKPGADGRPVFSPVYWLCRTEYEVPSWYVSDPCVGTLAIAPPSYTDRMRLAATMVGEDLSDELADVTDSMSIRGVLAVGDLVRGGSSPKEAATLVRLAVIDDPWLDPALHQRLQEGHEYLSNRVRGQEVPIQQGWDALTRSLSNLSGVHRPSSGRRPRIVLFLAGPTGTGKTEFAKAIAQLIFGDAGAISRFDMSGYSAEQSDQRLVGAPPGYVGYESGGELTNAVRARPFSVLLFDEIEKAHPRILDKFLQVLDEGQLDDGLGRRVFFDQSVVIFTSNLGIYEEQVIDGVLTRIPVVDPKKELYDEIAPKVRESIERHFVQRLGRAEILNRIGDNVVVFDFLRLEAAHAVFDGLIGNVVAGVRERHGVELIIDQGPMDALRQACCEEHLEFGGRGITNKVESLLLNPLGTWIYPHLGELPKVLRVTDWQGGERPSVVISSED